MDVMQRIEQALGWSLDMADGAGGPPRLAEAMRYAVFPGGARLRPKLALAVARACGDDKPLASDAAAAAIELLHCASLVHDDLPCFDDADTRRGKTTVHRMFGEPLAVLCGDALIVLAFETLARGTVLAPMRLSPLVSIVARAVGMPGGICAGQAWECEPAVSLSEYHRAKTGALFAAATMSGAAAAGFDPSPWRALGETLGEAFQVADDLHDVASTAEEVGKPVGRDAMLGRASAACELGIAGAMRRFDALIEAAVASVPVCAGTVEMRAIIRREAGKFLPKELARVAA